MNPKRNRNNKSTTIRRIMMAAVIMLCATLARATVVLPALIADNMVLQQQQEVNLWGTAAPGEQVVVKASWLTKPQVTQAGAGGHWSVKIRTTKAGGPYRIQFSGSNSITVNNVLLGEVWLASGQSNMEFPMGKGEGWRTGVVDYATELAQANYPAIRMIDVPNVVADSPLSDFKGTWAVCTPDNAAQFSAVAYYFARKVQQETGAPIGMINATWGGTPAESWTRKEVLESSFPTIMERYNKTLETYPERYAQYQQKMQAWKADTSAGRKGAPKEPVGPNHNKSPYKLYNAMIHPLLYYACKGVIWYQGESNAEYAWQYRSLFPAMVADWRKQFQHPDMPFYFVQIAPHKGQNPVIREAQLYSFQQIKNSGLVVTTDVGDKDDIHPRNKRTVGERLARWALHYDYGRDTVETSGPLYTAQHISGKEIHLSFSHASGMYFADGAAREFELAGDDQQFHPATARIEGNTIIVQSAEVDQPKAVRFAWKNVPQPNLFNAAGLPASPFRTDTWPVPTQDKN